MSFLISKYDLPDFVKFSTNIADELVRPALRDAHTFDVLPRLSAAEQAALAGLVATRAEVAAFERLTPAEQAAKPLSAAGLAYVAYWALPEADRPAVPGHALQHLYAGAVRPLLSYHTYRRFLLDHGAHVTPNGVETISGVSHQPITNQQRTEMRADAAAKCNHYDALLDGALQAYRGSVGSPTTCPNSTRRRRRGGLSVSAI